MGNNDELANLLYTDQLSDATKDFLEAIKITEYNFYDNRIDTQINSSDYFHDLICNNTTELGNTKRIKLSDNKELKSERLNVLIEIFNKRKSTRNYDEKGITFDELSVLLSTSYYNVCENIFTNSKTKKSQVFHPRRNIASGGGLYPVDIYVICLKVDGLDNGIYYYNIDNECIEGVNSFENNQEILDSFFSKNRTDIEFDKISGFIVFVGNLNRVSIKYRDRGLIYSIIDVGALMQCFYITSATLNIGCCGNGGYYDNNLHSVLKLINNQQLVLGTMTFGKI